MPLADSIFDFVVDRKVEEGVQMVSAGPIVSTLLSIALDTTSRDLDTIP